MIILLTGKPNTGKSTAIKKIVNMLGPKRCAGLLAQEIRDDQERVGFLTRGIRTGEEVILAHKEIHFEYAVEDFGVDVSSFERVCHKELETALNDETVKFVIIDEIGRMQVMSPLFRELLAKLAASGKPLIATICHEDEIDFIRDFKKREDAELIELDPANRNQIPETVIRKVNRDDRLYLSKIDLAHKYMMEPERYIHYPDRIVMRSTHDTRIITMEKGIYHCTCDYYKDNGVCSHTLSLLLRQEEGSTNDIGLGKTQKRV